MFPETSYGVVKRLRFIEQEIRAVAEAKDGAIRVADIGCGTGLLLTLPLGLAFKGRAVIYAYDLDTVSLSVLEEQARTLDLSNVVLVNRIEHLIGLELDVVIASEVMEHVENPLEFLLRLRSLLSPTGKLLLTVPNGYGWFEFDTMLYDTLKALRVVTLLQRTKRIMKRFLFNHSNLEQKPLSDTLAVSPHLNFFTLPRLRRLLVAGHLREVEIQGRSFACGSITDRFINRSSKLIALNNWLGSKLPLVLVSDWMIVASVCLENNPAGAPTIENRLPLFQQLYTHYKRFINAAARSQSFGN
jgi:2-polyprenyl-3-methyl-5-hydroxy-6-metoxy-1,4-benzoquinol methylase